MTVDLEIREVRNISTVNFSDPPRRSAFGKNGQHRPRLERAIRATDLTRRSTGTERKRRQEMEQPRQFCNSLYWLTSNVTLTLACTSMLPVSMGVLPVGPASSEAVNST